MLLQRLHAIRLVCLDPRRLARFYVEALGFEADAPRIIPQKELELLGFQGRGERRSLRLGSARVDLDGFDPPGRPYPPKTTAADLLFQHFAIATADASAAWTRARDEGAIPISREEAPVTLPRSAGGVTAVKFRDPEGHPLELLQKPPHDPGRGMQPPGIDHTAISVADLDTARHFYRMLGLEPGLQTLNQGKKQSILDDLDPVQVDVLAMLPPMPGPHLELLAYRVPRGSSGGPMAPNDVAATRTVWRSSVDALLRDCCGHLHLLQREAGSGSQPIPRVQQE